MIIDYFIVEDIWREIKTYLFHDIKIHGKHLKNDIHIKKFNKTLQDIPKIYAPRLGPRIIYQSKFKTFRYAKFIYKIPAPSLISNKNQIYKLLIEYISIGTMSNENVRDLYFKYINTTEMVY